MGFIQRLQKHAFVLLNSHPLKQTQTKGLFMFIVKTRITKTHIYLEFFNLIDLAKLVKELFSYDLWDKFKHMIAKSNHCFVNQQLYLAYQALLSFFLLTNSNEVNLQAKPKWNELGELLFYFNPYCKNKTLSTTSGRNLISEGILRSEGEISSLNNTVDNLILGNTLTKHQVFVIN